MHAYLRQAALLTLLCLASTAHAQSLRIGFANPLSGPFAESGKRAELAVALAIEAVNRTGGVLGRELELVAVDDACGIDRAAAAASELIAASVVFVVGHRCSHSSLIAAPLYEAAGIPMMSPESTHPRLTEEGRVNVFRLIGRDDDQGRVGGEWLSARAGRNRIGIVHDGSTYGRGLALAVRDRLRASGAREALFQAYEPGATSLATLIDAVRSSGVGVLYVGGYGPDAGLIARIAREQGLNLALVGGDGLEMDEFWEAAGPAGEGTVFTARRNVSAEPAARSVLEQFRAMGLGSLPTGLGPYAAVQIWAEAAERAGTADPAEVVEAIHRGRFDTVLGRVAFDARGDLEGAAWQWQVWRDGTFLPLTDAPIMN